MGTIFKVENADYKAKAVAYYDESVGVLRKKNIDGTFKRNALRKQLQASTAYVNDFNVGDLNGKVVSLSLSFKAGNTNGSRYSNIIAVFQAESYCFGLRLYPDDGYKNLYIWVKKGYKSKVYKTDAEIVRDVEIDLDNKKLSGTSNRVRLQVMDGEFISVEVNGVNYPFGLFSENTESALNTSNRLLIGGAEVSTSEYFWIIVGVEGINITIDGQASSLFDFFGANLQEQLTDKIGGSTFAASSGECTVYDSSYIP